MAGVGSGQPGAGEVSAPQGASALSHNPGVDISNLPERPGCSQTGPGSDLPENSVISAALASELDRRFNAFGGIMIDSMAGFFSKMCAKQDTLQVNPRARTPVDSKGDTGQDPRGGLLSADTCAYQDTAQVSQRAEAPGFEW